MVILSRGIHMKKQGISLIVLTITIIIMIIMAGAIIMTLQNTEIISKAEEAKEKSNTAAIQEGVNIKIADAMVDKELNDKTTKEVLEDKFGVDKVEDNGNGTYTVTYEGTEFIVTDEDMQVSLAPVPIVEVSNTYHIRTVPELIWFQQEVTSGTNTFAGKTVILDNNLNLAGISWIPIGFLDYNKLLSGDQTWENKIFAGFFEGNNKTISNIVINTDQTAQQSLAYIGLFAGNLGTIQNLTVNNLTHDIPGKNSMDGYAGLAGIAGANAGDIIKCNSSGTYRVQETKIYFSGIAGSSQGTITNCSNTASIDASYSAGITSDNEGTISDCYNSGYVKASITGAGISNKSTGTIQDCLNTGKIESTGSSGELAAAGIVCSISKSEQEKTNPSEEEAAPYEAYISRCGNSGTINSFGSSAGILGFVENNGEVHISDCYNTGSITSNHVAGGIIGVLAGDVIDYTMDNIYNSGVVTASGSDTDAGSLIGVDVSEGTTHTFSNCYYSGSTPGGNVTHEISATMKENEQMQTLTFATTLNNGRSPEIWGWESGKNGNYPYLK